MAIETVELRQRTGDPVQGTAEVTRRSAAVRATLALGIAVGGTLLGVATIVIPGVHLISTWLFPLLAVGIAVYVSRIHARVGPVSGSCPACAEELSIPAPGSIADEAVWVRCAHCQHPLELRLREQGDR